MAGIYVPSRKVRYAIRVSLLNSGDARGSDNLDKLLAVSLFVTKVFLACRDAGVTPQTATGDEVNLSALMIEAETELGFYYSPTELDLLNRWKRYEVEWQTLQRRRYCYSILYRLTSGSLSP